MRDDPRAARDLALIVLAVIVVSLVGIETRVVDRVLDVAPFGVENLNGIIPMLIAIPVAATVFSYRRYRDASYARGKLALLSMQDALTGLPNRRSLPAWYDRGARRSAEDGSNMAVLFVDLDHFKSVNDQHGHDVGDQLLAEAAQRMRMVVRPSDRVVRYGGDEFVILGLYIAAGPAASRLAERVITALEQPFEIGRRVIEISASIGIAVVNGHTDPMDTVLSAADAAMYEAKGLGSGKYVLVESVRSAHAGRRAKQFEELREALDQGQFVLHYQPIVSVHNAALTGAEALIRWEHPERGLVFPGDFIPDLEMSGLIVPVGNWVLEEACRQADEWHRAFPDQPFQVKLNVSASQLAHESFHESMVSALNRTGVRSDRICFGITESALMHDVAGAWTTLRKAKDRGIALALDDFGTGYSSLTHLRRFNLDYLKIDKSFVDGLGRNAEDTAIVEHVIGLAHTLGLRVVAEGIEEEGQVKALRALSCDYAQGYFFSRPQPVEVMTQLLRLASSPNPASMDATTGATPPPALAGSLIRAS